MLGVFAALLAFGAAVGRSRPAAFALLFVGVVVLVVALLGDRPTLDDKRGLEVYYGEAGTTGQAGGGYTLELIAGALALVAAGVALLWDGAGERVAARRGRRRSRSEEAPADSAA